MLLNKLGKSVRMSTTNFRMALRRGLLVLCLGCLAMPAVWAQLPPAVQADRMLQRAAAEMDKQGGGSPPVIVRSLEAARATGVRMPANFRYHLGRALYFLGESEESLAQIQGYLKEQGGQAKYYAEALDVYSAAEAAVQQDKRRGPWERFEWHDREAGELRDRKTGLIWQACNSVRGAWEGRGCTGAKHELTWGQAADHARDLASRSGKAWRLPTSAELQEAAPHFPGHPGIQTWAAQAEGSRAHVVIERNARDRWLGTADAERATDTYTRSMELSYRLVR